MAIGVFAYIGLARKKNRWHYTFYIGWSIWNYIQFK
jgi:hypothetical protein